MVTCPLCRGRRVLQQRVHRWIESNCAACGILLDRVGLEHLGLATA